MKEEFASKKQAIKLLSLSLHDAFSQLSEISQCGVLFSGGLDSSLAAVLTSRFCDDTVLFSSFAPFSHDQRFSSMAADLLGLNLVQTRMNKDEVWSVLPELMGIIKSCKRIDVEITLPFFFAARECKKMGITNIVSAQGPDTLFGGYARHVDIMRDQGAAVLDDQLKKETSELYTTDIERDSYVILSFGVIPHFPYLDEQFVSKTHRISSEWKVNPSMSPARKIILRELAQLNGVPDRLARAPKKATQYSSGSAKLLMEAVKEHIPEAKGWGKKRVSRVVQYTLTEIGHMFDLCPANERKTVRVDLSTFDL